MSFDANPYRVMEIMTSTNGLTCYWHCVSCGGNSQRIFDIAATVGTLRSDFDNHLANSHRYTRQDTTGWSVP